jgi:hypothetical protein
MCCLRRRRPRPVPRGGTDAHRCDVGWRRLASTGTPDPARLLLPRAARLLLPRQIFPAPPLFPTKDVVAVAVHEAPRRRDLADPPPPARVRAPGRRGGPLLCSTTTVASRRRADLPSAVASATASCSSSDSSAAVAR